MKNISKKGEIESGVKSELMQSFTHYAPPKQKSVRTTFTLTKVGEEALDYIIKTRKNKIKSIIDKLCEGLSKSSNGKDDNFFDLMIEGAKDRKDQSKREIRKTMVLSKQSLSVLNDFSKKHSVPRDIILDESFQIIAASIKYSSKNILENHKKALSMINKLMGEAEKIENQLVKILDEDDPVLRDLSEVIVVIMNLSNTLKEEQEKGNPVSSDKL